jgi:hypothetical protein
MQFFLAGGCNVCACFQLEKPKKNESQSPKISLKITFMHMNMVSNGFLVVFCILKGTTLKKGKIVDEHYL